MTSGLMMIVALFCAPLILLVAGFVVMICVANLRNWMARPRGPELIVPSWRITEQRDRRVVVQGDDPVACAEDDRRAVAALLAADRDLVAAMRRMKPRQRVIRHGLPEGSEGAVTVVEVVPTGPVAWAEAEAIRRQFGMPARRATGHK